MSDPVTSIPTNHASLPLQKTRIGEKIDLGPVEKVVTNGIKSVVVGAWSVPGDNEHLYVAFQHGLLRRFHLRRRKFVDVVLDFQKDVRALDPLSKEMAMFADERGAPLGFVAHPQFNSSNAGFARVFYVYYSTASPSEDAPHLASTRRNSASKTGLAPNHYTRLSQFRMMTTAAETRATEIVLMEFEQPEMNHNGGALAFSPYDGILYIGMGDGGGFNDQHGKTIAAPNAPSSVLGNALDLTTYHGKILRIDVFADVEEYIARNPGKRPYGIPSGSLRNWKRMKCARKVPLFPLDSSLEQIPEELFAYGFRNPWRFDFDCHGRLMVASVGQDRYETLYLIDCCNNDITRNYGWRAYEGRHVFDKIVAQSIGEVSMPVIEYDRRGRPIAAVIGGYFYDGKEITGLGGSYVFGDYSGTVYRAYENTRGRFWEMEELAKLPAGEFIHSFARDSSGEIHILAYSRKKERSILHTLVPDGMPRLEAEAIIHRGDEAARMMKGALRVDPDTGDSQPPQVHIAVITRDGRLYQHKTSNDAWTGSEDIARGKANTALAFSSDQNALTTRTIGVLSQPGQPLWQIGNTNREHGIVEFPGGIPLYDPRTHTLLGAVGVSGSGVNQDEAIAVAAAAGYEPPALIRSDQLESGSIVYTKETDVVGETILPRGASDPSRTGSPRRCYKEKLFVVENL